jgi:mono/diheme cytochrome c family protein
MRRCAGVAVGLCVAVFLAVLALAFEFNPSALSEPGKMETDGATTALRILVWRRASSEVIPPAPANRQASVDEGDKLYGIDCGDCHGLDGHTPTDEGRWMYPRAANLVSSQVQKYSNRELFWIVKNGIRLTGMPAFGKVETDEHIWNLIDYLRTLPRSDSSNSRASD